QRRRWRRLQAHRHPPVTTAAPAGATIKASRTKGRGAMRNSQRGITLLGFIIVLAVVGLFAYVGMKLFPMYSEYYSVRSAMKGLANEPGIANTDPRKIQDLFFRRLKIDYTSNRSEEHTSELQSRENLVCRLLLEKKKHPSP